jgi:hypothetical protein
VPNVIDDGSNVAGSFIRLGLDDRYGFLVTRLLAFQRTSAVGVAKLHPAGFGAVRAAFDCAVHVSTQSIELSFRQDVIGKL